MGHAAAGWRVSVWDEEEAAFLDGCVVGFDARANHFLVSGHGEIKACLASRAGNMLDCAFCTWHVQYLSWPLAPLLAA